jgi:DNA-binding SARP family transcriptional activator
VLQTTEVLDFRLLGPLEVIDGDGRPLPLGGQKQRALLALLLLDANKVVSTDRLLDVLWDGEPPRTAATSLQNMVSALRKQLGREHVVTRPPGYALDVDPRQVDLSRLEQLIAAAKLGEAEQRAAAVRAALALWRGEPLAEFAYDAFAQAEIARLAELRSALLEARIEADLAAGRHEELVGELEGLVAQHPVRERLRGQQMLALYRTRGRRSSRSWASSPGRRFSACRRRSSDRRQGSSRPTRSRPTQDISQRSFGRSTRAG